MVKIILGKKLIEFEYCGQKKYLKKNGKKYQSCANKNCEIHVLNLHKILYITKFSNYSNSGIWESNN